MADPHRPNNDLCAIYSKRCVPADLTSLLQVGVLCGWDMGRRHVRRLRTYSPGVSFPRLNEIIHAKRGVTPDTALRLAQVTGMSADFWLGLQSD